MQHCKPNYQRRCESPSDSKATSLMLKRLFDGVNTTVHPLLDAAYSMASKAWADSTWQDRCYLIKRYAHFTRTTPLPGDTSEGMAVAAFVEATAVSLASRLQYAKTLHAVLSQITQQEALVDLKFYMAGLRASGAMIPTRQAQPATKAQVATIMAAAPTVGLRVATWLAWKSASRWGDIAGLKATQVKEISPNELLVSWGQSTKTGRQNPFTVSGWTLIRHTTVIPPEYVKYIKERGTQPLTTITTDQFDKWVKTVQGCEQLTAHSLKRGALTHLLQCAADGKLRIDRIATIAKHAHLGHDALPATTLRYVADTVALARALGTHEATVLL